MSDAREPILIRCEGSGCPTHRIGRLVTLGICQMCGQRLAVHDGIAPEHTRRDLLAMIERGDFDE